jgi:hypothetical protein
MLIKRFFEKKNALTASLGGGGDVYFQGRMRGNFGSLPKRSMQLSSSFYLRGESGDCHIELCLFLYMSQEITEPFRILLPLYIKI